MAKSVADIVEGAFVRRRNRFIADVEVASNRVVEAHLPNTGRMKELLVPGALTRLRPVPPGGSRRTRYDLTSIRHNDRWVGMDARITPGVVVEAWRRRILPSLAGYSAVRREVRLGRSRLDLLFDGPAGRCYVEAKSVNLVVDGVALFPDAPTTRGTRHLAELVEAVEHGDRAAVAFVIQRDDAVAFAPFEAADPAFAAALRRAAEAGVETYAISCAVDADGLTPERLVPVRLHAGVEP